MALSNIVSDYQRLKCEWDKKPPALKECGNILSSLKVKLVKLITYLPLQDAFVTKQELIIARDILEIGAQYSIACKDCNSFERYMAQLKTYYFDYSDGLPESVYKYQLLGLNLLRLLAQNKLAEFHTELELLPTKDLYTNVYIKYPVSMEQYLMEGSYNKVFLDKLNIPAESYNFFVDILLNTTRDEIASCCEKAYERLNFNEIQRMLFHKNSQSLKEYANNRGWRLEKDNFFYFSSENSKTVEMIPAADLSLQAIDYAKELEMIV